MDLARLPGSFLHPQTALSTKDFFNGILKTWYLLQQAPASDGTQFSCLRQNVRDKGEGIRGSVGPARAAGEERRK